MSKKKVLIVAAVLLAGGAAIAISAPGHRGHGMGGLMDRWTHGEGRQGFGLGGLGGRWGGEMTREAFDGKVRERFARFDLNSDGIIDVAEIEAALAKGGKHRGLRHRRADRDSADKERETRGGRSVSKSEYLDEVRRRFALLDLDGDGRITDADLPPNQRGRGVLSRLSDEQGQGMRGHRRGGPRLGFLHGATVDKDGGVTLDEVVRTTGERFDRMDRNKDGTLDRADRQVFGKEMTDYRVKRILHRFGATTDGKITREQAFKVAGEMFTRLDRNKDGTIGRGERPGKWHRHRDRHDERGWRGRGRDRGEERTPGDETKKI
jgi:Ca2+-binding EF-hand superfamily protein